MSPKKKLTKAESRGLILAALRGESVTEISKRYGVTRDYVYKLMNDAKADPEGAYKEARAEWLFRKKVRDLLG